MNQIRTPAARYAEAITYLHQSEFSAARSVIEALPEEHDLRDKQESERYRMLALIDFFAPIYEDGRTNAQLSESEQSQLLALIADQRDRPATWAQNILCFHYKKCRAPLSGGDGGTPKSLRIKDQAGMIVNSPSLRMYPNPASNYVVFEVDLAAQVDQAAVVVQDVAGRVLQRLIVTNREQQLVFDTRPLAPGSYTVQLMNGSATLQTKNLIIRQ